MDSIIKALQQQSPIMILIVIIGYFGKIHFEKKIESIHSKNDRISASSLAVKTGLRNYERDALVELHEAITEWEHYLISAPAAITTGTFNQDFANNYYDTENNHALKVKKASAKLSVLLSDRTIDYLVYDSIVKIQKNYYPAVNGIIDRVIGLRTESHQIQQRIDSAVELEKQGKITPELQASVQIDFKRSREINQQLVNLVREASEKQLEAQKPLRETMESLKVESQALVYRSLKTDQIGSE